MELRTAKAWGLTPDRWDALDSVTKAEMIAYERTDGMMTQYEMQEARKK